MQASRCCSKDMFLSCPAASERVQGSVVVYSILGGDFRCEPCFSVPWKSVI